MVVPPVAAPRSARRSGDGGRGDLRRAAAPRHAGKAAQDVIRHHAARVAAVRLRHWRRTRQQAQIALASDTCAHARHVYAKTGSHSLGEAVEQARALRLLAPSARPHDTRP